MFSYLSYRKHFGFSIHFMVHLMAPSKNTTHAVKIKPSCGYVDRKGYGSWKVRMKK